MATLADMKTRIASEIARGDLTSQISQAILDAIDDMQGERFYFNEPRLDTEPTFNTTPGVATYGAEALPAIGQIYKIDYIDYIQGTSKFKIYRRQPEEIDLLNQFESITGPPSAFAYSGRAISLYPIPDTAYVINIMGVFGAPAPATDAELNNPWMNDGERLIRALAKYKIAVNVTRNATLMQLMSPDPDGGPGGKPGEAYRAWQSLKIMTNKMTATGRIAPMRF